MADVQLSVMPLANAGEAVETFNQNSEGGLE